MNDKELLELAAIAGGIDGEYTENPYVGIGIAQKPIIKPTKEIYCATHPGQYDNSTTIISRRSWNPLNYDDDSLRLAVKLKFEIFQYDNAAGVLVGQCEITELYAKNENNENKATRRAIVRAAAEIGRNMK